MIESCSRMEDDTELSSRFGNVLVNFYSISSRRLCQLQVTLFSGILNTKQMVRWTNSIGLVHLKVRRISRNNGNARNAISPLAWENVDWILYVIFEINTKLEIRSRVAMQIYALLAQSFAPWEQIVYEKYFSSGLMRRFSFCSLELSFTSWSTIDTNHTIGNVVGISQYRGFLENCSKENYVTFWASSN